MARVTAAEVQALAPGLGTKTITTEIDTANALVTDLLAGDFDEPRLKLIETWLAAHFAVAGITTAHLAGSSQSGVSVSVTGEFGMGLTSTEYGQRAMALDTTGKLALHNRATSGASESAGPATARLIAL